MSDVITGNIVDFREGTLYIKAPYNNTDRFIDRKYNKVKIELVDGRPISDKQRRMCYALLNAIADWSGDDLESEKQRAKITFQKQRLARADKETLADFGELLFSLSNAPVSLVREFQRYLIEFIIREDVPVKRPLLEFVDDINDYVYQCILHKKCVVCGKYAELHHIDAVGMGNDRDEIVHEGLEVMSLCRAHHTEAHQIGVKDFMAKYHFDGGVIADKSICKLYGLKEKKA